jgi:hypothetical protein
MANEHRIETTLGKDRSLVLKDLPFQAGEEVEVIILPRHPHPNGDDPYTLRGSVLQYDDPFEPAIPPEDWEAQK